jgi:hypothetical protein
MKNPTILAVAGGFYFFGDEVTAPEGYVALTNGAMFGGFGGGKGLPGVARGDPKATVILDKFEDEKKLMFPITTVYAIFPSVDLYSKKTTTLR